MKVIIKELDILQDDNIKKILAIASESIYIKLSYENIKHYIESKYNKVFVCYVDKVINGFLIFSHIENEIDIIDVAVAGNYRNKNIGSSIINNLIKYSKKNNASKITLELHENNTIAYSFYLKHNFKVIASRKNYYDNKYSAVLMSLEI